ncbi:hypothetical protein NIES2109_62800 (plasmid) [Nostoc sp. HK-01]|nr:hypothetical protein NIES2109_62800 [Nostoc sp. HK-01]
MPVILDDRCSICQHYAENAEYFMGTSMLKALCRQVLKMVARKPRIMFSCSEDTKEDLESWAEDEGRSISNLIERIVMDAIAKRKNKTRKKSDEE